MQQDRGVRRRRWFGMMLVACGAGLWGVLTAAAVEEPPPTEKPRPKSGAAAETLPRPTPAPAPVAGTQTPAARSTAPRSVEQITEAARKSVVVITFTGRDGKRQGLGSGFLISADGLIATNMHVIGEARPVRVQLADGTEFPVSSIIAHDRRLDLALLKIDTRELPFLELGDSNSLKQGQTVVALGNPHGLKQSVVSGVVSGTREIDDRPMIQLAMPIEPGNSGGPVLDLFGRVQGIVTMKSAVTENLGFAVAINVLKPLRDKPNPTLMSRWLTIGALDPKEWQPLFGANWRQRAGRVAVEGLGDGFGGRSLCLWQHPLPKLPCEIGVTVKLDREEGAAGLVFFSDGKDQHYGFYPSNGKLRLVRFDGPDVFSWKILAERQNDHYRPGDWNTLKVRIEKGKLTCFINDKLAIESQDAVLTTGKVGLAKFRSTAAEFRNFRVGAQIPDSGYSAETVARVSGLTDQILAKGTSPPEIAQQLATDGEASVSILRERAKKIEAQARQLRDLAQKLHQKRVQDELAREFRKKETEIDLFHAGLLISLLDNEEVDVESYRRALDRLAGELAAAIPKGADPATKIATLNRFLFDEHGFHGSRGDYYHRSNSYLNEVLDDREGLPITLSVLYLELARRLDLNVVGVGLPGHFVVKFTPPKGEPRLIDAYERGQEITRETAAKLILAQTGRPLEDRHLAGASKREIAIRMLRNLLNVASREQDFDGVLRYLDTIIAIHPETGEERWMRAVLQFQKERKEEAKADVEWLLDHKPADVNLNDVDELRRMLERATAN